MKKLMCKIFGHKYIFIKQYKDRDFRKIGCARCKKEFIMERGFFNIIFHDWNKELEKKITIL